MKIARPVLSILMSIGRLDWKSCLFSLIGYFLGVFAVVLGNYYGMYLGLSLILLGWWSILIGLLFAKHDDLPVWRIGYHEEEKK